MKLTINLDAKNIEKYIIELYAHGFREVAEALETEFTKEQTKTTEHEEAMEFLHRFVKSGIFYYAYYNKNSKGEITTALYEIWGENNNGEKVRVLTRKPLILSTSRVYGRPEAKRWIENFYEQSIKRGVKEV